MSDSSELDTDDLVKRAKGKEPEEDEEEEEEEDEEEDDYSGETDDSIFTDSEKDEAQAEEEAGEPDVEISDEEVDVGPSVKKGRGKVTTMNFGTLSKKQYDEYLRQKPNEPMYRYRIRMAVVSSMTEKDLTLGQIVTCSE